MKVVEVGDERPGDGRTGDRAADEFEHTREEVEQGRGAEPDEDDEGEAAGDNGRQV